MPTFVSSLSEKKQLLSTENRGAVFTKTWVANLILDLAGYSATKNLVDTVAIEPVLAMEFKSHVGPSFGNNVNNRAEEAIGNATDIWIAYREGRFGNAPAPFIGYLFILEDCPAVHKPVQNKGKYFKVDPAFSQASYSKRYEILCRRLVLERLYTATCLLLCTNKRATKISQPAEDLSFRRFVAALKGHAATFTESKKS